MMMTNKIIDEGCLYRVSNQTFPYDDRTQTNIDITPSYHTPVVFNLFKTKGYILIIKMLATRKHFED
jgi:hypothetical protein